MKLKKLLHIITYCVLAVILIIVIGIVSSLSLNVTSYTVQMDGLTDDIRIVLLSDLHAKQYGENNSELLELVRQQKPDIICLVGDMFDETCSPEQIEQIADFSDKLTEIAPTYYSYGNHENTYLENNNSVFFECFSKTEVIVLNEAYIETQINGATFRLGGMDRYAYRGGDNKFDPTAEAFLLDFCNTDLPTVLLSHRPESFSFKNACAEWDVDLILSGHTHGGLVRLPFIGGLYAPIQGLFPKTVYGEYQFFNSKMIVTSGLSGYGDLPRIFNPPEICVITLTNAQ